MFLINSLFSQKDNFLGMVKMRSHEYLYFLFETQSIKHFFELFTLLVVYGTLTKHVEQAISDWSDLEVKLRSAGRLGKQTISLYSHSSES